MKKIGHLKSALMLGLLTALLCVPGAYGKTLLKRRATPASENSAALVGSSITLLPDGRLLAAGGQDNKGQVQATLLTRDPSTGMITMLGAVLLFPRAAH